MASNLELALEYAKKGWSVFPVSVETKQPLTQHGFIDATTDEERIKQWWSDNPSANIGIATGKVSGIFVVDVDKKDGGVEYWKQLEKEHNGIPNTLAQKTPSGGFHLIFKYEEGIPTRVRATTGTDVRSDGAYIATGTGYQWVNDNTAIDAPQWVLDVVGSKGVGVKFQLPDKIPSGERNATLARYAGVLRRAGISNPNEIFEQLKITNEMRCEPKLSEDELMQIAVSISKKPQFGRIEPTEKEKVPVITEAELEKVKVQKNPKITINLPKNNLLSEYIAFRSTYTEIYDEYLYSVILLVVSAIANKRVWAKTSFGTVNTNIWIMDIGDAGKSNKSSALAHADYIMTTLCPDLHLGDTIASPQGFVETLEGEERDALYRGHGLLVNDEVSNLLAAMERQYMVGIKGLLCALYDGRPTKEVLAVGKKKKSQRIIRDPYLCLLFSTTPEGIRNNTKAYDIESGFLMRFLYTYPDYEKELKDIGLETREIIDDERAVLARVNTLKDFFTKYTVVFSITQEEFDLLNTWRKGRLHRATSMEFGLFNRSLFHAIKLAMIFQICEYDFVKGCTTVPFRDGITCRVTLKKEYLEEAMRQIDEYFLPVAMNVFEMTDRRDDKDAMQKIINVITSAGGKISRSKLIQRTHIRTKDLDEYIHSLVESELIEERVETTTKRNRTIYILLGRDTNG